MSRHRNIQECLLCGLTPLSPHLFVLPASRTEGRKDSRRKDKIERTFIPPSCLHPDMVQVVCMNNENRNTVTGASSQRQYSQHVILRETGQPVRSKMRIRTLEEACKAPTFPLDFCIVENLKCFKVSKVHQNKVGETTYLNRKSRSQ